MSRSVSLTFTADDYVAANKLHAAAAYRSRRSLVILAAWALIYFGLLAAAHVYRWNSPMIVLVHFYVAALIVFIVVNYYLVAPISARRNFRMHKLFYQSPRLFHMFPKRVLTAEQIADI